MRYAFALGLVALVVFLPAAAACEGLSPGDQMSTDAGLCTLAFVLADPDGLYFATAGHCIQVNQTAQNPDYGEIGVGVFHFLEPENGDSSDGSPGMDFGLIRINPDQYENLNPKVCGWDGPVGVYEGGGEGGGVRHYGHGVVFTDGGPTTQKREGLFLTTDEQAFYWTGAAVLGDSGSAVLDENNLAVGVFTHVLAGVNGIPPADNGGTRLQRGLELAAEAGFTQLRLVLAGEDPRAVLAQLRGEEGAGAQGEANETAPTPTPTTKPTSPTSATPPTRPGATPATPDDSVQPAAEVDAGEAKGVPAPPVALVLAALAVVALRRRKG